MKCLCTKVNGELITTFMILIAILCWLLLQYDVTFLLLPDLVQVHIDWVISFDDNNESYVILRFWFPWTYHMAAASSSIFTLSVVGWMPCSRKGLACAGKLFSLAGISFSLRVKNKFITIILFNTKHCKYVLTSNLILHTFVNEMTVYDSY